MEKNKLSGIKFAEGMEYIEKYYTKEYFKVDLDNVIVRKLWYDVFKNVSDDEFEMVIKSYCLSNVYPPQNPSRILEHARNITIRQQLTDDEAWEYGYNLVKRYNFNMKRACDEMEENGYHAMARAFTKMGGRFVGLTTASLPYLEKDWKERYLDEIDQIIRINVNSGNLIGTSTHKLLDDKGKDNK